MSKMKRFTKLLRTKSSENSHASTAQSLSNAPPDSPEAAASQSVRSFCEGADESNPDEDAIFLPAIVESAESSPAAAAACAYQIQKFLARGWSSKPRVQYNAIMLIRILSDNPGPTFTRNLDKAFVSTVKELLRGCRDKSTQTIMRETLDSLEVNRGYDEGLQLLLQMWRKEKGAGGSLNHPSHSRGLSNVMANGRPYPPQMQQVEQMGYVNGMTSNGHYPRNQLPPPSELASRIEEAKNTAKILMQLVQSTPSEELMGNELIKEFSERCQSAQKSMQSYCNCDNPPPDDDTLQTLIETNEQLSLAGSRYQRAVLSARRTMGAQVQTPPALQEQPNGGYMSTGSAFAAPSSSHQDYTGFSASAQQNTAFGGYQQPQQTFAQPVNHEVFQPPPGPPPKMANGIQSGSYPPQQEQYQPAATNPFEDPEESLYDDRPAQRPQQAASQGFAVDATDSSDFAHPASGRKRSNTFDLENAYSAPSHNSSISAPSPTFTRDGRASEAGLSEVSPQASPQDTRHGSGPRPGPGPWHHSGITPSYMGRQSSAADGLTMHGAQSDPDVAELDGRGNPGRR
ncbi:hypothetical protein NU219Hw_g7454t1 [Hortaea werneckii]